MRTSRTAMAVLMLLAGLSVGLVAKSGAGKQAGIIPVADILTASRDEQLEDWETLILDEEVPLVPGPGMLGTESGAAAGYAPPVIQESPYVRRVVALVNEERTKAGLLPWRSLTKYLRQLLSGRRNSHPAFLIQGRMEAHTVPCWSRSGSDTAAVERMLLTDIRRQRQ